MHIIFDPRNRYIGVGENHVGAHAFDFNNESHTSQLKNVLANHGSSISVFYEGPNERAKSPSYKNFVNELKKWKKINNIKSSIREVGWETDATFPKEIEYSTILLGPEPPQVISLIGKYLDGKRSLLDAIVDCKNFKGSQSRGPTKEEVIRALSNGSKPSDVLETMMEDKSANPTTVRKIYGGMRDKYFEGTRNALVGTPLYRRVNKFNELRDTLLARRMHTQGGIFLAGDDHIRLVENILS